VSSGSAAGKERSARGSLGAPVGVERTASRGGDDFSRPALLGNSCAAKGPAEREESATHEGIRSELKRKADSGGVGVQKGKRPGEGAKTLTSTPPGRLEAVIYLREKDCTYRREKRTHSWRAAFDESWRRTKQGEGGHQGLLFTTKGVPSD